MRQDNSSHASDHGPPLPTILLDDVPAVKEVLNTYPDMRPRIGSHVPRGWDAAVAGALHDLIRLSRETAVEIRVAQIKEKFGGLRLYLDVDEASAGELEVVSESAGHVRLQSSAVPGSVRERAMAIVRAAEVQCANRCTICGAPATSSDEHGMRSPRCPAHVHRAWR